MTYDEVEIVANAGVQLREIAERLTLPASQVFAPAQFELVSRMDAAALSISEVYGQLSALPLEAEEIDFSERLYCTWPNCDRPQQGELGFCELHDAIVRGNAAQRQLKGEAA